MKRGPKAPRTARRAVGGPKGPPSPPQELEGRARSALNFYIWYYYLSTLIHPQKAELIVIPLI